MTDPQYTVGTDGVEWGGRPWHEAVEPPETHIGKAGTEHQRISCRPRWCGEFPPEGQPLAATPEELVLLADGADPVDVYNGNGAFHRRPIAIRADYAPRVDGFREDLAAIDNALRNGSRMTQANAAFMRLCRRLGVNPDSLREARS